MNERETPITAPLKLDIKDYPNKRMIDGLDFEKNLKPKLVELEQFRRESQVRRRQPRKLSQAA